jgi:hypothetical protein
MTRCNESGVFKVINSRVGRGRIDRGKVGRDKGEHVQWELGKESYTYAVICASSVKTQLSLTQHKIV